jgi:hypothetical protein
MSSATRGILDWIPAFAGMTRDGARFIPGAALYPSLSGVTLRRRQETFAKIEVAQQQFRREM